MFNDDVQRAARLEAIRAANARVLRGAALALCGAVLFIVIMFLVAKPARAEGCAYSNSGRTVCAAATAAHKARPRRRMLASRHRSFPEPRASTDISVPDLLPTVTDDTPPGTFNLPEGKYDVRTGMVTVRTAQGFFITVNPRAAVKFLKAFALIKQQGWRAPAAITRCFSWGGHKPGSNHHIGMACDIQTAWNKGPSFVYSRAFAAILRAAGLHNGCSFGDCGHFEAVSGLHNPRGNVAAAMQSYNDARKALIAARDDEAKAWRERPAIERPIMVAVVLPPLRPVTVTLSAHRGAR